MESAVRTQMPK